MAFFFVAFFLTLNWASRAAFFLAGVGFSTAVFLASAFWRRRAR